jgi:hypothetical protein
MYIILVGPAGVANKSTSMRAGEELLASLKEVSIGPSTITWQKIAVSLQEAQEELKLFAPDGTETKHKMACLSFFVSELGTFFRLGDTGFTESLIDWFDAQDSLRDWTYDTKTSGTVAVRNPWINLIGCTTPSWLQANFPENMIGGGLTSRILFVYGDKKRQLVAYPSQVVQSSEHKEMRDKLVFDLRLISTMGGEYHLTAPAIEWGTAWYKKLWSARPIHMAGDRYDGYIARKQTHMHKIAMVLAASQSGELLLHDRHLQMADQLLSTVEPDMVKVFSSIGAVSETRYANEMLSYIAAYGFITPDNLWKLCRSGMKSQDFEMVLKLLVQNQMAKSVMKDGRIGLIPLVPQPVPSPS